MLGKALILMVFAISANLHAQDISSDVYVDTSQDFIAFELTNGGFDMQLNVSGPQGFSRSQKYAANELAYVDVIDAKGRQLADGLYKYEIRPVPTVTISREESSAMPDRNDLYHKTQIEVSPVSGNFRVLNGRIADDLIVEAESQKQAGS
jgi:hypothetical protein